MRRVLAALGVVVLSLLVAYLINRPIPQGVANPYVMRTIITALDIAEYSVKIEACSELKVNNLTLQARIANKLGFGEPVFTVRTILNYAASASNLTDLEVFNTHFDGIPVRIYRPEKSLDAPMPGFVFYHGGGFSLCSVESYDTIAAEFARSIPAVLVAVDYRLAPEHPFPAGLNDNLRATKYFLEHARDLGVDQNRIAIGGDSAGGNFAAVIATKLRDAKNPVQPKVQVLLQPLLQAFNFQTPSYLDPNSNAITFPSSIVMLILYYMGESYSSESHVEHIMQNKYTEPSSIKRYTEIMNFSVLPEEFLEHYVPPVEQSEVAEGQMVETFRRMVLNPDVSPLLTPSFQNLPPAFIHTARFDSVRDDGALYAHHLKMAGVDVTWYHANDTFHGHLNFVHMSDISRRDVDHMIHYLRKNL